MFADFEILNLHEPLRQSNDPDFARFLDSIGDDYLHDSVDLSRLLHTQSVQDVIDFVFPNNVLRSPEECINRAILSPYNQYVDDFNGVIIDVLPGIARTYYSSDTIDGDDTQPDDVRQPLATPDYLNALKEPGIPPHELTLKVGAICRFTRNFSAARGITKNTRVIVQRLMQHSVEVRTLPANLGRRAIEPVRFARLSEV